MSLRIGETSEMARVTQTARNWLSHELDMIENESVTGGISVILKQFTEQSSMDGIWWRCRANKMRIQIISVPVGGPACEAGLRAGDFLHTVNGTSFNTAAASIHDATNKISGPVNELLHLEVMRASHAPPTNSVTFESGDLGLAIKPQQMSGNEVCFAVTDVQVGSQAAKQAVLLGSILMEISGSSIRGLSRDALLEVITSSPRPMTMLLGQPGEVKLSFAIRRKASSGIWAESVRRNLKEGTNRSLEGKYLQSCVVARDDINVPFGLTFRQVRNASQITIVGVEEGSISWQGAEPLIAGDIIESINGETATSIAAAARILKMATGPIVFTVLRSSALAPG